MKEKIIKEFAPCGIDCSRCVKFAGGTVVESSGALLAALEGFESMAERMKDKVPALASYPAFRAVLEFLSAGSCRGCRSGDSQFPLCSAKDCHREKGVNFCFECGEFPCRRNSYPPDFEKRWIERNTVMRDGGLEKFCTESKMKPRY